jgi:hypothetical protein
LEVVWNASLAERLPKCRNGDVTLENLPSTAARPEAPVRRSNRKRQSTKSEEVATTDEPPAVGLPVISAPTAGDPVPAVAAEKPKRRRVVKPLAEKRPTKKAAALIAGAPSEGVQVWDEEKMAAAVAHLSTCEPGHPPPPSRPTRPPPYSPCSAAQRR